VGLAANQIAVTIENARLYHESLGERAKVRAIVDACADGILVVDADSRIVDANPALGRITGHRVSELLGHCCTYLLNAFTPSGQSVCEVYCPIRLAQEPPAGEMEACIQGPTGDRWVGITYGLLRDAEGKPSGVVHTIRDISAHKSAERAIAESGRRAEDERRRLQAILDNLPEGVCIADVTGGRVVLANRKALELLGRPECLLAGCGDTDAPVKVSGANGLPFPAERLPLRRSLQGEYCEGVQLEVRRRGGGPTTLLVNSAPLLSEGTVYGAVATFQDIGNLKEVERMKDSFIAAASHELRTPITSIRGYAQLLLRHPERGGGHPDNVKATHVILRQVDRLVWLVNQLLDASRAQKGELGLAPAPCDLRALVAEVVDRKRLLYDRHEIRLQADEPVHVMADAPRIEQVLVNLLNNAIEYSPCGGPVDVYVRACDGQAVVAVEDRGIGIPADRLDGIFERFYCAHSDLPRSNGGLGLGLYVSYQIVARHGGRMWVESKEDVGSVFSFALPVANLPLAPNSGSVGEWQ
jgi:PAS domain S-box-containing protein